MKLLRKKTVTKSSDKSDKPEKIIKKVKIITKIPKNNETSIVEDNLDVNTYLEEEVIPQLMEEAIVPEVVVPTKPKFRSKTLAEDPMQYHAKPKDLSKNAISIESITHTSPTSGTDVATTSTIFSTNPFSSLPIDSRLMKLLEKGIEDGGLGLTNCTYVQSAIIPLLSNKKQNVLMKSQTGSGKTLAYLIPIINDLISKPTKITRNDGTYGLIIAPTRELCSQISDVMNKLVKCCVWIVCGCISGGEKKHSEKARLRKGITILVATPGRLLDHLRTTESFNLNNLQWIVLDEADRLLDLGLSITL